MVVDTRFELVTPAMSMQCSTAELIDRPFEWRLFQLWGVQVKPELQHMSGRHNPFNFINQFTQMKRL